MTLLREMLTDGWSGRGSSKRAALLIATLALSAALLLLALAAYVGRVVDVAIGSVAAALAGLGGAAYVGGKSTENRAADGAHSEEMPAAEPSSVQVTQPCFSHHFNANPNKEELS